jgi:putative ABC transport system ATP-binding protein
MNASSTIVRVEGVKKCYPSGDTIITALATTTEYFEKGKLTLIMGPSGSGKTTLLSLIGCVIYPTEGNVYLKDQLVNTLSEKQLAKIRLHTIGFVFQQFNLVEPLTALENVMQPLLLQGMPKGEAKTKATEALEKLGLEKRINNLPKKLSGGQKQRVAIARALVTDPEIMQELKDLSRKDKAVIIVTHDLRLRQFADRIIYVEEGKVSNTISNEEDYK